MNISGSGKKRKQDETLNVGGRFYIKKGCKVYLDKEKGEMKIENV